MWNHDQPRQCGRIRDPWCRAKGISTRRRGMPHAGSERQGVVQLRPSTGIAETGSVHLLREAQGVYDEFGG